MVVQKREQSSAYGRSCDFSLRAPFFHPALLNGWLGIKFKILEWAVKLKILEWAVKLQKKENFENSGR